MVERLGLADKAAGYRAVALWADAAGPDIAKRTAASRFVDGVLYVDVDSPAWASQLTFMREALVERLNERLSQGKKGLSAGAPRVLVREIRFRVRTVRGGEREAPLTGLALVRWRLRCLPDDEDEGQRPLLAFETGVGASGEKAFEALRRLLKAHRRLERAKLLSGWEKCRACGRVYEAGGKCPCRVSGGGPGRAGTF